MPLPDWFWVEDPEGEAIAPPPPRLPEEQLSEIAASMASVLRERLKQVSIARQLFPVQPMPSAIYQSEE